MLLRVADASVCCSVADDDLSLSWRFELRIVNELLCLQYILTTMKCELYPVMFSVQLNVGSSHPVWSRHIFLNERKLAVELLTRLLSGCFSFQCRCPVNPLAL